MPLLQSVRRLPVFESLHNRDFRWFWVARLAHSASMEMGSVALGWLAYQLTGSALALGWVASARSIARLILSLYGGALADRLHKRQVLIWARAAMLANVLAIAVLILSGVLQVWHLIAYSFVSGVISALMMPAQKAYLAQLVDRKTLLNAVSLTFASMGLMGVFGASAAGYPAYVQRDLGWAHLDQLAALPTRLCAVALSRLNGWRAISCLMVTCASAGTGPTRLRPGGAV